jgi:hypothetical protein
MKKGLRDREAASQRSSTRVQLELPEKSMARLLALKEMTEASSYAEVIKDALRLYEHFVSQVEQGNQLMLKDKEGNIVPYHVFVP